MLRIEMLNDNDTNPDFGWQVFEELRHGRQAACRCSNSDNRKRGEDVLLLRSCP
jgi:hypothetical protein